MSVNNYLSFKKDNIANKNYYLSILKERQDLIKNKIKFIIGDARDYKIISKNVDLIKPNYLIHLAAVAHANISNKDPYSTFDNSMRTLENTLDACRSLNYLKDLFISPQVWFMEISKKRL